jgi:hypothetical protein
VLRAAGCRFFYSGDRPEPPHVHVERGEHEAKFWRAPISLAQNVGYDPRELRSLEALVREHQEQLLNAWHLYFYGR